MTKLRPIMEKNFLSAIGNEWNTISSFVARTRTSVFDEVRSKISDLLTKYRATDLI